MKFTFFILSLVGKWLKMAYANLYKAEFVPHKKGHFTNVIKVQNLIISGK